MRNTLIAMSCLVTLSMFACTSSPKRVIQQTGTAGTTGTAGAGTAGAGTAGSGTAGNTGGTAGAGTAGAGTAGNTGGTAGAGTAGAGTAGNTGGTAGVDAGVDVGAGGAGGSTTPCTMGAVGGAGGGTGSSCANTMWTFTPNNTCMSSNPACGFCTQAGQSCAPADAIDGNETTRYTSGEAQVGGENFVLAFASPVNVTGIKLDSSGSSGDATTSYLAEYSLDGTTFQGWCPPLAGPGAGAITDIVFPAAISVKAIRITQTGVSAAASWWSLDEVTLDNCQ